jgi:hypothetical protein
MAQGKRPESVGWAAAMVPGGRSPMVEWMLAPAALKVIVVETPRPAWNETTPGRTHGGLSAAHDGTVFDG